MLNKFTIQTNFAISAGAGSGKTYTLSRRYINALLGFDYFREDYTTHRDHYEERGDKAAKVKQIVTITYTEAAALEMKGRIFELVSKIVEFDALWEREEKKRAADPEYGGDDDLRSIKEANDALGDEEKRNYVRETLRRALIESAHAKISTIHAFCLDIIKANADITRIDTKLEIIKEDEKAALLSQIIREVLNAEENRETVLEISQYVSMYLFDAFIGKYVGSAKFRQDFENFDGSSISKEEYKALIRELYPLPDTDAVYEELAEDEARKAWFEAFHESFERFDAKEWGKLKEDEKAPSLGTKKFPETTRMRDMMKKLIPHYRPIDDEKEALFFAKVEKIKGLLKQIKAAYDAALYERQMTDFDTIISRTAEIVGEITHDFRYIMVDEFQDTNLTQYEIVRRLAEGRNLFVVGDSKQSIYAFQGAEIEVFNNAVTQAPFSGEPVNMSVNYRSDGVVLDTVNRIFEKLLAKDECLKLIAQNFEATPQKLEVSKPEKEGKGSFRYLITSNEYEEEEKLVVGKCLQLRPWREFGESFKVYKMLLKALQKIWKSFSGEE